MHANDEIQARQIKDAPFAWQHKRALQMIRDYLENRHGHSAFALSVYVALTELASDAQSGTFTATISEISRRAGASYRTTWENLNQLGALKLIHVQRHTIPGTKGNAPSTYTLCTPCLTLCKRNAKCLQRVFKNQNNQKNHDDTCEALNGASANRKSSLSILSLEEAKKHPEWETFNAWCNGRGTLKGFNTWLQNPNRPQSNGAKPRLAVMKSKDLQSLRDKLIAERNSGKLTREEMDAKREQLLEIKEVLKGCAITYPSSL